MARSPRKAPLITIIGATGTGKSELAVALAQRYNGEVINGDAMQLYEGLPIITNKITEEEKKGIPHHLLGRIGLGEPTWVVGTFVKRALGVIEEIRSRGKLPILVGGTHYYTQSLLFHDRLFQDKAEEKAEGNDENPIQPDSNGEPKETNIEDDYPLLKQPTDVLLDELRKVDPVMAERWHPNDRRKIQRSLSIYLQTGRKASDIYAEQRQAKDVQNADGQDAGSDETAMRFANLIFWVHAEPKTLRLRLDGRVDKMLERGLLDEVHSLNAYAAQETRRGSLVDESRGIWISIGYKEFKHYTAALKAGDVSETELDRLKQDAVEKTQVATRQYAKRQVRWIRIKLVNALAAAHTSNALYLLDGSDARFFQDDVVHHALDLTEGFLAASPMPEPRSLSAAADEQLTPKRDYDYAEAPQKWLKQHCGYCNVTCVTEKQWESHAKSRAHRRLVSKRRKQDEDDAATGQQPVIDITREHRIIQEDTPTT